MDFAFDRNLTGRKSSSYFLLMILIVLLILPADDVPAKDYDQDHEQEQDGEGDFLLCSSLN
jgi:hypothetical protein